MSSEQTDIPTQFNHRETEGRIYEMWEKSGVFKGVVDRSRKPFCVVMPPPNVTGILHMGHVLDNVPQDVMTRWHRMRGFAAVWIPGTDHAGIATQNVVAKELLKQGIQRKDLGREKFLEKVWDWKKKHGDIIINQLKRIGCSCDWDRERFTMDEGFSRAVLEAFITLYNRGLIYRGKRMVNWCTVCNTALSDEEVEHEDRTGNLWHLKYPILNDDGTQTGDFLIVATTRPETMLGDTGVAVHPEDERYKHLHGKKVLLPLVNRVIPVVADDFVDSSFGTGVVKLTPSHDPNDYLAGQRHGLEMITVIDLSGQMSTQAGEAYAGLGREDARKKVVADLEAQGFLEKTEKHQNAVGVCYRCKSVLEPLPSEQWFVKMRPLADKARQAVVDGRLSITPDSEKHDYFHWMDTIQDWCISRQLWWGHRIPVYYCDSCSQEHAALAVPASCSKCQGTKFHQDEDVLDTWFSSQLWPFGTLGWPEKTEELDFWFPNSWLMSGRDILFFWDVKMIISALELLGDVPFRGLALHGMVRDEHGRKLSKSLGNSADPLELFDTHGTDAVRAAIALHYPMGRQDTRLADQVYQRGQSLITKLWNATRLLMMNLAGEGIEPDAGSLPLSTIEDRWIITRLRAVIEKHDQFLEQNDFCHALGVVNSFFWDDYCDWYLEIVKPRLREQGDARSSALTTTAFVHLTLLKLFHPYCPFVTEELWQSLQQRRVRLAGQHSVLALAQWPEASTLSEAPRDKQIMQVLMSIIRGVRDVRQNLVIPPKKELAIKLVCSRADLETLISTDLSIVRRLAYLTEVSFIAGGSNPAGAVPFNFDGGIGFIVVPEDIDMKEIATRLDQRLVKMTKTLQGMQGRLSNAAFVDNAPAELVEETRAQARELEESIAQLTDFRKTI